MTDVKEQVNRVGLAFTERGLKFEHVDDYEKPMIRLNFGGGDFSYTHVTVHVIFDPDGTSAQIITGPIASVPIEKTSQLMLALNECNCKFRWLRFYLDGDNDVIAGADVLFTEQNAGDACTEVVMRAASIIDDAYPDIMKGIWS